METWRQCERIVDMGLAKHIGMSNMTIPKLEAVLPLCRIQPANRNGVAPILPATRTI